MHTNKPKTEVGGVMVHSLRFHCVTIRKGIIQHLEISNLGYAGFLK